ncbi:unnamed protein product [Moneuplotes crassus]|uniref:Phospholipid scramblase n=1 Tax=Euplotes crassus TaxID=5936 RepID=A0AAD1XXK8_EUPCR|nr:unnamed protein product [Moneuplotes crassus]
MGKVRFIQDKDYTSFFTCGFYRPNHRYYLVDENDKILFTIEEDRSTFTKFCCNNDMGSCKAILYLGYKHAEIAHYQKDITIPSCFCNLKRPTTNIIDPNTTLSLGKITNPVGKWFSCKGQIVEVRDSHDKLCYELYNDSFCVPFFCCPLPLKYFNSASFKINFPSDALMEGETKEMNNNLDLTKEYSDCAGEWCSATVLFEFNTISSWTNFDYARFLAALHMMTTMYFHD